MRRLVTMPAAVLHTARLVLRPWRDDDLAPFAALNADPDVMRHFPSCLDRAASDALARRIGEKLEANGYGLWAVEALPSGGFIGFTGLNRPDFQAHFTPCLEIGWRLARAAWGRGYATEAARAALGFAFDDLGEGQVVAFTAAGNDRSRAVMARLGMSRDPVDDFDHPALPEGHALRRHVLYRSDRPAGPAAAPR